MHRPYVVLVCFTLAAFGCRQGETGETGNSGDDTETDTDTAPPVDVDEDGFSSDDDCDDYNPAIHPGAEEVWDLADNDCDGRVDANGLFTGTASMRFSVVFEGQLRQWDLSCPGSLERSTNQIALETNCGTASLDSTLATTILGEEVTIREVDNVASEGAWGGEVQLTSTADWETDGAGTLIWVSWNRASGQLTATAQNLSVTGSWSFDFSQAD